MTLKFTLKLASVLDDLVLSRVNNVVPDADGFTQSGTRSINGTAQATYRTSQWLNLVIDATLNQSEFALFEEYLYEQENNDNRGNIVLRNEYFPVNTRWSTINSRSQVGSAQTLHGSVTQYFVEYPILLTVPLDYWEVAGQSSRGQWKLVKFTATEITS